MSDYSWWHEHFVIYSQVCVSFAMYIRAECGRAIHRALCVELELRTRSAENRRASDKRNPEEVQQVEVEGGSN